MATRKRRGESVPRIDWRVGDTATVNEPDAGHFAHQLHTLDVVVKRIGYGGSLICHLPDQPTNTYALRPAQLILKRDR